jgi:hypothetical protein
MRGYRQYFQEADRDLYAKAVERKLFSVLASFLDEHGIAAKELGARLASVQDLDLLTSAGKLAPSQSN